MQTRMFAIFLISVLLLEASANEIDDTPDSTFASDDVTTTLTSDMTTLTPDVTRTILPENITGGFQGELVQEGTFSFVVSVRMHAKHVNVGTIIGREHVLTEAWHYGNCSSSPCNVTVRSGSVDVLHRGETRSAVEVTAHEAYQHPHFDLAIIKVSPPFSTEDVAHLPSANQTWPPQTEAVTLAWGGFDDQYLTALRADKVAVLQDEACSNLEDWYPDEQICTRSLRPGSGLCDGDYGAPLIVNRSMVAGINIFNTCGGETAPPDRFLDLVPFLPWINKHLQPAILV